MQIDAKMFQDLTLILLLAATTFTGLLAGASLDQSIKQLPARHRIGVQAFSQYSRAADLASGVVFYGILGVGALLFSLAAALSAYFQGVAQPASSWIYVGALLAVLHTLVTAKAAPTNFSQRMLPADDEAGLAAVFDRFARWQNLRCALQVVNFAVELAAVVVFLSYT